MLEPVVLKVTVTQEGVQESLPGCVQEVLRVLEVFSSLTNSVILYARQDS